jgi:hypothetical protein
VPRQIAHATHAGNQVEKYFSRQLAEAIYRKFQPDFEHFGYAISP